MGGGAEPRLATTRPGPGLRIARLVTEVTAPAVLVSLLIITVSWHSASRPGQGLVWGLLATLFVTGIPFAYIVGGVRRGRLTDHHVGRREQRRAPLLVGLGSVAAGLALLAVFGAPRPVLALAVAGLVGLVVAVSVSHWWGRGWSSPHRWWGWSAGPEYGCGTTRWPRCWPEVRSAP